MRIILTPSLPYLYQLSYRNDKRARSLSPPNHRRGGGGRRGDHHYRGHFYLIHHLRTRFVSPSRKPKGAAPRAFRSATGVGDLVAHTDDGRGVDGVVVIFLLLLLLLLLFPPPI